MPASAADAFEAFFNHEVRRRWDTLLRVNYVEGGGTRPYRGAITVNEGRGWKAPLSMRTEFLTYDPPRSASAKMVAPTGPFALWAASMHHKDLGPRRSEILYTYSIRLRPRWLGTVFDPLASLLYRWETRRRFAAMSAYLAAQCTPSSS